jgi:hypothetical protein
MSLPGGCTFADPRQPAAGPVKLWHLAGPRHNPGLSFESYLELTRDRQWHDGEVIHAADLWPISGREARALDDSNCKLHTPPPFWFVDWEVEWRKLKIWGPVP